MEDNLRFLRVKDLTRIWYNTDWNSSYKENLYLCSRITAKTVTSRTIQCKAAEDWHIRRRFPASIRRSVRIVISILYCYIVIIREKSRLRTHMIYACNLLVIIAHNHDIISYTLKFFFFNNWYLYTTIFFLSFTKLGYKIYADITYMLIISTYLQF